MQQVNLFCKTSVSKYHFSNVVENSNFNDCNFKSLGIPNHNLSHIAGNALASLKCLHEIKVVGDRIFRLLIEDEARTQGNDIVGINVREDILKYNPRKSLNTPKGTQMIHMGILHLSHEKNPLTFHYTGWLIGILIMVYYSHYITG